jgi:hypothetical protein
LTGICAFRILKELDQLDRRTLLGEAPVWTNATAQKHREMPTSQLELLMKAFPNAAERSISTSYSAKAQRRDISFLVCSNGSTPFFVDQFGCQINSQRHGPIKLIDERMVTKMKHESLPSPADPDDRPRRRSFIFAAIPWQPLR